MSTPRIPPRCSCIGKLRFGIIRQYRFLTASPNTYTVSLALNFPSWRQAIMIVGLFPELLGTGGVQRAGQHVAAVAAAFARERNLVCELLSLNDPSGENSLDVAGVQCTFTGFARSKRRFVTAAMRASRRGARVVIAAHPNLASVVLAMRLTRARLHSIICTHGMEVWKPLSYLRRFALQRANLVLAPSRDTAERAAHTQNLPVLNVRRLPWALDPAFAARAALPVAPAAPVGYPEGRSILTVGRWDASERYKGMDHLIAALPRLLTDNSDIHLVAVGEGDDRGWLENLAEEHGVALHVHYLSGLTQEELGGCYAACDVFALPSRGEGFGLVYLEAMAYGKPVIAGAHGGAPEIVEDGATGYLVPHGDVPQLASALATLLGDPELRKKMGARGRGRVEREYQFAQFAKSLKRILKEQCVS